MLHVTLIACGRLKERYLREACAEYEKRLKKYISLEIKELQDGPDKEAEAIRILPLLEKEKMIITLEIEGKELDSTGFAEKIRDMMTFGTSRIVFVIGGSEGISKRVTGKADLHLSFSKMTFPHQLMRVIFLEQLYRAFRIINNEPYHK